MRNKKVLLLKALPGEGKSTAAIQEKLLKRKIGCVVASFEDISMNFRKGKVSILISGEKLESFSVVIFRTVGRRVINREIAFIFSHFCKKNNIKFFDKNFLNTDLTPKLLQMYLFGSNFLYIPKTYYFGNKSLIKKDIIFGDLKFPMIAKNSYQDRGKGIFLLKNRKEFNLFVKTEKISEFIFQEFIPNDFDWRLTVIGSKVGVSEKRIRQTDKFRNNVYLGAKEEFVPAPKEMQEVAIRASKILKLDLSGVDIIDYKGRNYILEVNRAPSFTLDENISQELHEFERYILKCLK